MFDTYIARPTTTYVDRHEHRAPTDESVKILKEYQERALGWAKEAVEHRIEGLNVTAVEFAVDIPNMGYLLYFRVNGSPVTLKAPRPWDRAAVIEAVVNEIAKAVTVQLLGDRSTWSQPSDPFKW